MKKMLRIVITVAVFVMLAIPICAEYTVYGNVFSYDGTSGTAGTPNSYAALNTYREGIPDEIGHQNNGELPLYPSKIYAADGSNPAFYYSDVGSSDWPTPITAGQVIITVVEIYDGLHGYTGSSYIGCAIKPVSAADITASQTDLPDMQIEEVPAPSVYEEEVNHVTIQWTGLNNALITGYTVYRKQEPSGTYTEVSVVAQDAGNTVQYIDDTLLPATGYTYKIAPNVVWNGGGGAPEYYVSNAQSPASSAAMLYIGTLTITPTLTPSATPTATSTISSTITQTVTSTITSTVTLTITPTLSLTVTETVTMTSTMTTTPSVTPSITPTLEDTVTSTPTITPIVTRIHERLAGNIAKHRLMVLNNPVRDKKLKFGVDSPAHGLAVLYIYNIHGGLVRRWDAVAEAGANIYERKEEKLAPGLYLVRVMIRLPDGNHELPIKKMVILNK